MKIFTYIAGTAKVFELTPDISPSMFPETVKVKDTWFDDIEDEDYGSDAFEGINLDNFDFQENRTDTSSLRRASQRIEQPQGSRPVKMERQPSKILGKFQRKLSAEEHTLTEDIQLPNGKWECRHKCTDKTMCVLYMSLLV